MSGVLEKVREIGDYEVSLTEVFTRDGVYLGKILVAFCEKTGEVLAGKLQVVGELRDGRVDVTFGKQELPDFVQDVLDQVVLAMAGVRDVPQIAKG